MAKNDIDTIVKRYQKFINGFGRTFLSSLDNQSLPEFSVTRKAAAQIDELSSYTIDRMSRYIVRAYLDEQKKVRGYLRSQGIRRTRDSIDRFKKVNESALDILLRDPYTGFVPVFSRGLFDMKKRIRAIELHARGLLNGTLTEVSLPFPNLFTSISLALFVRIPTRRGPRNIRMDKFVRQLLNDATSKARAVAMRNKLLEHGQEYIAITVPPGSRESVMGVYSDKVFALSKAAAQGLGVPHVSELPNGGVPMHPNSKIKERPWLMAVELKKVPGQVMERPPEWALNRPFELVRSEHQRRTG